MPGSPTQPSERNLTLDVLHGAALLGVLLADFPLYAMPLHRALLAPGSPAGLDGIVGTFLALAVHTKFLTILTLLFGSSLAILEARERDPAAFALCYLRRLAFLLALGVAHTALVWHSVLLLYAPCGLAAFFLRRAAPARMLRTALALLALGAVLPLLVGLLALVFRRLPNPAWLAERAIFLDASTWSGVARFRLSQFAFFFAPAALLLFGLRSLGTMLLGIWMFREGAFSEESARAASLQSLARWGLGLGLPLSAAALAPGWPGSLGALAARWLAFYAGGLALAFGYVGLLSSACLAEGWRRRLAPLARVGRACLSSFLLASTAFSLLAYPFGLGLYGKVGHLECAAISLAVFFLLERLSALWLARFRFGPLEWLLRAASYGEPPRLRV